MRSDDINIPSAAAREKEVDVRIFLMFTASIVATNFPPSNISQ